MYLVENSNVKCKCPKVSDKMIYANSAIPDQTVPEGESDQVLHYLPFY